MLAFLMRENIRELFAQKPFPAVASSVINVAVAIGSEAIAIGCEDGNLIFLVLSNQSFQRTGRKICHFSSIKSLAVTSANNNPGNNKYLLAFGGGRATICLYEVVLQGKEKRTELYSVKISSDVTVGTKGTPGPRKPWTCSINECLDTSECRVNSLKFLSPEILVAACSDGFLRVFDVLGPDGLDLKWQVEPSPAAVLKCQVLPTLDGCGIFLAGSSDGLLRVFTDNKEQQKVLEWIGHSAGITAIDVVQRAENCWIVATGGDDNALSLAVISANSDVLSSTNTFKSWSVKTTTNSQATACQISGVRILSSSGKILSVGLDQRFVLWDFEIPDGDNAVDQVILRPVAFRMTNIADIHDLVVLQSDDGSLGAVAVGQGIEWIRHEIPPSTGAVQFTQRV
ncbi:unnamed protein product [Notodromas monacha]|uniref:tRNA (34-2'-O)-methyltransferase regulator WDR6 n=1 Tax=Notodromas monacha TaxID=399045 RepID=A0A7R9BZ09_9CRUS|nr:unnamed protein product [Notodromas monacha]CAG0923075.1 unnamed protein product [Notodromas monacha]